MHPTLLRAAATFTSAAVLTLGGAATAAAETQSAKDPRGDVERALIVVRTQEQAPKKRVIDIIGSTNRWTADTLRMSVRTTNLPATNYIVNWAMRVDGAEYRGYYTSTIGDVDYGFYVPPERRRGIAGCTVVGEADRERATITLRVSSGCLGSAESVRIACVASRRIDSGLPRADDARRRGINEEKGGKFGPALAKG